VFYQPLLTNTAIKNSQSHLCKNHRRFVIVTSLLASNPHSNRQTQRGEKREPLPPLLCQPTLIVVVAVCILPSLAFNLILAQRIVVAPSVEVDDVTVARIFEDRTIRS
jgi:hypothetical protein